MTPAGSHRWYVWRRYRERRLQLTAYPGNGPARRDWSGMGWHGAGRGGMAGWDGGVGCDWMPALRIARRPSLSGKSTGTRRSNRPGRKSAASNTSARLVAAGQSHLVSGYRNGARAMMACAMLAHAMLARAMLAPAMLTRAMLAHAMLARAMLACATPAGPARKLGLRRTWEGNIRRVAATAACLCPSQPHRYCPRNHPSQSRSD